ncbi:MAG TPA: CoA transferase [Acidimicrobiales bacterium]
MRGACAGLRILDVSSGMAGPMATMVLADFGADVVRVEPVGGDPGWSEPSYLLLNRGKRSIDVDLANAEGRERFLELAADVDVVVETLGAGRADELGVGYDSLSARNPALIYCAITGFGDTGPLAAVAPDDALVMAKAGAFRDQSGWHHDGRRPVFRATRDGSYFAAMLAVQGILAALRARDLTGQGQRIDTSMLQALSWRNHPTIGWLLREGEVLPPDSADGRAPSDEPNSLAHHQDPRGVVLTGMLVECKDGRWIIHAQSEPHFFRAWIDTIGFDWIWEDERFRGAPYALPDQQAKDELVGLIKERMRERTAAEWMSLYLANGNVCAEVIETTQEALEHPQVVCAGYTVEVDDPRVGRVVQIGPLARIPGAPAAVRGPAPIPGADTDSLRWETIPPRERQAPPAPLDLAGGPLDGITIIECAYYAATPLGNAFLAELGARVIKIEPLIGDPYRRLAAVGGGDPVRQLGHNNMARAMQGKESIALNLKDPRGREILHALVAGADAFVHSFRVGVPESLGIDEQSLRAVNPDLVYHYAGAYGTVGPYRRQPAIDPVIAAFSGQTAHQSGAGNLPLTEIGADPTAAAGHATALMLGLTARERTSRAQYVESTMIMSNLYANADDALAYAAKEPRPELDALQLGTSATYRLYETAPLEPGEARAVYENPDPRWVYLAAVDDKRFRRFCAVAGCEGLTDDPRFATEGSRARHRDELAAELEPVMRSRTAPDWEQSLLANGVGCVQADAMSNLAFLYQDPQAKAVGLMTTVEHPSMGGTYWRHAPLLRFSRTPTHARTFCDLGEHTRALLDEIGYDDARSVALEADGVVSWPSTAADRP